MGVAHHANYVHWMEEARIDFMDQLGFPYARMEAEGVVSPVVGIECRYRKSCTFGDEVSITVAVESFSGVKMTLAYDMRVGNGEIVCTARSVHAFLGKDGRILRLKRELPEFCAAVERSVKDNEQTKA